MTKKNEPENRAKSDAASWALTPLPRKGASDRDEFARFDEIVKQYSELPVIKPPVTAHELAKLTGELCVSGVLTVNWSERPVPWVEGLGTLCSKESPKALGQAASDHDMALCKLYKRWTQLEYDPDRVPMYQVQERISQPDIQDCQLMAFLPIERREFLSEEYVTAVLKPYVRAVYDCRQIFWEKLKEGHCNGAWLCFQPNDVGSYELLLPGTGFDGQGNYNIDRATYLSSFERGENEIPIRNYPHTAPGKGQDRWKFVAVDDVLISPVGLRKKRGRKEGSGFNDDPFVQKALEHIETSQVSNANAAVKMVLEECEPEIEGASYDAKLDRLRKKVIDKLEA
jgi:hypothetical protein